MSFRGLLKLILVDNKAEGEMFGIPYSTFFTWPWSLPVTTALLFLLSLDEFPKDSIGTSLGK